MAKENVFKYLSLIHTMPTEKIQTLRLEDLVVLPDATNVFDIRPEDFEEFMTHIAKFFSSGLRDDGFDWYIRKNGVWLRTDIGPLAYRDIEEEIERSAGEVSITKRTRLYSYSESRVGYPGVYFDLNPRNRLKVAFLKSRNVEILIGGLYLSVGDSTYPTYNPYLTRNENIFVVRSK